MSTNIDASGIDDSGASEPPTRNSAARAMPTDNRTEYLVRHAPGVLYACDVKDGFRATFVTDNVRSLFGYEPEECLSDPDFWRSKVHPDDAARIFGELDRLLVNDRHLHEYRFLHGDGTYRWVRDEINLIRDEDGNPTEMVGIWAEIRSRNDAEESLRGARAQLEDQVSHRSAELSDINDSLKQSEEQYRLLVELSPDAVFVHVNGKMVFANPAMVKRMGADSVDRLIGMNALEVVHPAHRDEIAMDRVKLAQSGVPLEFSEVRYVTLDGREIQIEAAACMLKWSGRDAFMVVARDITERKRAEAALSENRELFKTFLDNWPSPVLLKGTDGRFRIVNKRYQEWYGIGPEQAVGRTLQEISATSPFLLDDSWADVDRMVVETGTPVEREIELTFKDGSDRLLKVSRFPVFDGVGTIIGVGQFQTDITAQRTLETQLREAHRMEAVGLLTGGVAHEFNNLLLVISGNLEMCLRRTSKPELRALLSTAIRGASRGAELTQHLLAFSRNQDLKSEAVALNDVVLQSNDFLGRTIGEAISVTTELADDLWITDTDPGQVEGALLNLYLNARDAMPNGGALTVRTYNLVLGEKAARKWPDATAGEFVVVEVADNGMGMTEETLERAFEPFFTTKDVGEGTGLGLSVVYGFAKQSGGFVGIASDIGTGTRVRLYLPRSTRPITVARSRPAPSPAPRTAGRTILVVEDDPDVQELVVAMIGDLGYVTVAVDDGRTALRRLAENPNIELLFTDIVLPHGMSGVDVVRAARRLRNDLKIIYTSGYPDQAISVRSLDGEDAILVSKPYSRNTLAEALSSAMGE